MLEIPIAITVGPAKADAPLMSGSTVNGVPPISFQESLDASARNHTTLTKFTVVSPHAIQDEKISALHGAMHSEESMPGFCLAVDANTSTEAGECTGAPNQYSREREGDFPANDGASKNDSQPEAVEDLNQVNKPSVTGLNAANAHGVGVYKQLGLTSSNCGPRIVIVQKTNAKGDMKIAKDKSEVKKLTANAGSSGETPLVTPSVAAVEEMQRGSIATIQSVPVMIPQQGPPTIDKASNDVPTGGVSDSHRTASIEKRSAPLRGDFSVKERITNTEQTVVEGNRVSHSRIESSQEQDGVQPSSGAMNPLFHQRMDGASSSRAGQDSSPAMLPVINGPSHMLTHSSPDRVHVLSGSTHAEMTSTEVASAGSSAITTGEEHRALAATPTLIEVGINGGTHGWLKVRAELASDGGIHASVSSASTAGEEMLRRELPSLTTYLHHEQVPVNSLVVHATANTQDFQGMAGESHSGDARHQQQTDRETSSGQQKSDASNAVADNWVRGDEIEGLQAWLPSSAYAGGGWLSVRA